MSMESVARVSMMRLQRGGTAPQPLAPGTVRRTVAFAAQYRARLIVFVAASVVSAVLGVASPVLAGDVVNAITGGTDRALVVRLALLIAAVALADAALSVFTKWLSSGLGERVIYDLRTRVFDHVQRMPVAFFQRTRTGALVSRLNNDVIGAQSAISRTLSGVVANAVSLALTLAVMLATSWQITLLSLVLLPLFLVPARMVGGRLAALSRERAGHNAAMGDQMTERFSAPGATLIKLFGEPGAESAEFARRADRVRATGVDISVRQAVFTTLLTLVSALALAAVYGVGGLQAIAGTLDAGDVVTMALLLTRLYAPLTSLANARIEIMSALVSFERVFEVLDLEPLITEPAHPVPVPDGPLAVTLDDVHFAYPSAQEVSLASLEEVAVLDTRGGEEVLHGVDVDVPAGRTVALVGSSGAGKSTIASLVTRLYDVTSGAVRLGGVDVRDMAFADLHRAVGMVTQDGHLFHDTVRGNLLLARPAATDAEVWDAVDRARLRGVVESLPDGLDTVVGERGYRLSGGERQRMTIARLLLAAPRVVVLDEATAALDSTNERAIQEALREALAGRTAVVIAHRLSTVRDADEILVVEGGRIVERGPHAALLAAGGRYAELYTTQFAEGA
ncbi:ABC transporter ATP-binding protein/permease [Micrococcus porci]|uniref:ABC transporter ATP-binding protein n=1 Tax=Micrococcus TaxID=1269 RepID=UPI001CCACBE0|nr:MULTISPECIES: ABC transporter ATP-binding protein [Micrococcus]MCG7422235.1 ABC transporter ATP-binding protein/permease [Micrococcus sp. ACRRV]UBH24605.1 ABC transporter ATP-binding protein/permease [Micrococcus porci]